MGSVARSAVQSVMESVMESVMGSVMGSVIWLSQLSKVTLCFKSCKATTKGTALTKVAKKWVERGILDCKKISTSYEIIQ